TRPGLVQRGGGPAATGAAAAPAAAAGSALLTEVERLGGAPREREAGDENPRPGGAAARAGLAPVPLRERGQDLEGAGAGLAAILVNGHLMAILDRIQEPHRLIASWPGLVSDRDPALVEDSLVLLDLLAGAGSLVDVGSGGGLPGLPLKLARPELR